MMVCGACVPGGGRWWTLQGRDLDEPGRVLSVCFIAALQDIPVLYLFASSHAAGELAVYSARPGQPETSLGTVCSHVKKRALSYKQCTVVGRRRPEQTRTERAKAMVELAG